MTPSETPSISEVDPLGQAYLDYWRQENDEIIRVHCTLGDPVDVPASWFFRGPEFPEIEAVALDLCKGKVMDLGAGVGSHALELQVRKHEVVALDILPEAVDVMKGRGVKHPICGDLHSPDLPTVDTILMLMNGIGAVSDINGLDRFLAGLGERLRPEGTLIFDSTDLGWEFGDEAARCKGEVEFTVEYRGRKGSSFPWLFLDQETLVERALHAGLTGEVLYQGECGHYLACIHAG